MGIKVTKLDAARRQLEASIDLFFHDRDILPIHTLAAAANGILSDLGKTNGIESGAPLAQMIAAVKQDKRGDFIRALNHAQNYLKHADRDPKDILSFDNMSAELLLLNAVVWYQTLTDDKTILMEAYYWWYLSSHPQYFFLSPELRPLKTLGPAFTDSVTKGEYLQTVLPLLTQLRQPK